MVWSMAAVRSSRVTRRGSVAQAPHYRRAERLLRGRSGGGARLSRRQRHSDHHRFRWGTNLRKCFLPPRPVS
jgi:hypothetical protein